MSSSPSTKALRPAWTVPLRTDILSPSRSASTLASMSSPQRADDAPPVVSAPPPSSVHRPAWTVPLRTDILSPSRSAATLSLMPLEGIPLPGLPRPDADLLLLQERVKSREASVTVTTTSALLPSPGTPASARKLKRTSSASSAATFYRRDSSGLAQGQRPPPLGLVERQSLMTPELREEMIRRGKTYFSANTASAAVMLVEMKPSKSQYSWHNPAEYEQFFHVVKDMAASIIGSPLVPIEAICTDDVKPDMTSLVWYLDKKGWGPTENGGVLPANTSHAKASPLRFGAFEVYLLTNERLVGGDAPRCVLMHSKLWTRMWPNPNRMRRDCQQVLQPWLEKHGQTGEAKEGEDKDAWKYAGATSRGGPLTKWEQAEQGE